MTHATATTGESADSLNFMVMSLKPSRLTSKTRHDGLFTMLPFRDHFLRRLGRLEFMGNPTHAAESVVLMRSIAAVLALAAAVGLGPSRHITASAAGAVSVERLDPTLDAILVSSASR